MKPDGLKYLLRSGSLRFVREHNRPYRPGALSTYDWNGQTIWYRPGSSDSELIYKILLRRGLKGEYAIPPDIRSAIGQVDTILDIGANIGISSIYLGSLFPQARLFAFEPAPENVAVLERNMKGRAQVRVVPVALGERDGTLEFFASDSATNFGGFSRFEAGSDVGRKTAVPVRHAGRQFAELGVAQADIIKVDVEGSEWEIMNALGEDFLSKTKYICGELHGHRDFELLASLSRHFHIAVRKSLRDRLFMFQAVNKAL